MSKSLHLDLHDTDSEDLGILDSVSLPSEPPDIRNWFPSYVYESPELDKLDGFEDSDGDGTRETCLDEKSTGKSGNNHSTGQHDDAFSGKVPELSESLPFSAEPPDIRNWFSSYVYESPPLGTAFDFALPVCKEREDGMFNVVEKSSSQNMKDPMASISVEKTELCKLKYTSDVVDYQSVRKDDDDDDDRLQPLPSKPSLSNLYEASDLSGLKAGNHNNKSLEKIGSTNANGNDYDAMLHSTFSSRNPTSLNIETNIGSQDGKSVLRLIGGSDHVKDGQGNKDVYKIVSPQTIDRIVHKRDSWESPADRSMGKEKEETKLLEDGFISVRKKSRQENAENVARVRNGAEAMITNEKDTNIVRKVLSEISNFHHQNIRGTTGKWSCPQKNKPDLGPPLKQLRLDQWVRRV